MAKPAFANNHLGIRRDYVLSLRWRWLLVVLFEDGDFCSFFATKRACLKYVRSEIQGCSFADLWDTSTFIRVGKYSQIAIELNPERHSEAL